MVEPLFDSFIAFKPHGVALTLALASRAGAKRLIKSNPQIWLLAKRMRRTLLGQADPD